jgi:hypothetical protein
MVDNVSLCVALRKPLRLIQLHVDRTLIPPCSKGPGICSRPFDLTMERSVLINAHRYHPQPI